MKTYFFGCKRINPDREVGHYMYGKDGRSLYGKDEWVSPWGRHPDGTLCPQETRKAGIAMLHHKDGWTALSFWDYSGDNRGNSNSNFFFEGEHSFEDAVRLMKENYPKIGARFNFDVVPKRKAASDGK